MYNTLKFDISDGIATITFNRPYRYNSLNDEMSFEFIDALKKCREDDTVRVVIITGEGKAFNAGQDLKDVQGKEMDFEGAVEKRYNPMTRGIVEMEKPVICKMNGVAAGAGASIAIASDYTIAADHASMIWAFVNIGLVWDSGSSFFLPRLVGRRKAFELATLGEKVTAHEAVELGLINKAVPAAELDQAVMEVAQRFAKAPTLAIGLMKKMLNQSFSSDLNEMLEAEKHGQNLAGHSEDYQEGVNAFLEKRKPEYKGR